MTALTDLRDLVADDSRLLSAALLRAKILASKLKHQGFKEWVEREMNGYPDGTEVPAYRILQGVIRAQLYSVGDGHIWREVHPIPFRHFPDEIAKKCEDWPSRQGIGSLEHLVAQKGNGSPRTELDRGLVAIGARKAFPGWSVVGGWLEFNQVLFVQLLASARSRLLDFILRIEEEMPEVSAAVDGGPAQIDVAKVEIIFQTTINGDVTNLALASPWSAITNTANDLEGLAQVLATLGVDERQVQALRDAVKADESDRPQTSLGSQVGGWLKGLAKSAAGQVVEGATRALMTYYGLPT